MKSFLSRRVKRAAIKCVEVLESRCLLSISTVGTIPSQQVDPSGTATTITLGSFLNDPQLTGGTVVVMQTPKGNIPLQLTDSQTPMTVANFKTYIANGDYGPTVIQRAAPGFVIQGGGTRPDGTTNPSVSTLLGEPGISNTTGTIAMALSGGKDTGNNQWFINLANNTSLDNLNNGSGPFTVFGNVIDNGMSVVTQISQLPTLDAHTENSNWGLGAQLGNLPVIGYTGASPLPSGSTVPQANLVTDNIVQIPSSQTISYSVTVANPSLMSASVANGVLTLTAAPGMTSGQTSVMVTATDLSGQSLSQTFSASLTNGSVADVTLGAGGAKSVNYLDTDGTNATLSLKGSGTAVVHFAGTGLNPVMTRQNTVILSSTTAGVSGIDLTNTGATSAFTITTKGGTKTINIGTISTGAIRSITGKGVTLTGDVNASGAIGALTIAGAAGGTINASSLGVVTASGAFSDNLTVGGAISRFTAGAITGGTWFVSGATKTLTAKAVSGWNATFSAVNNMTIKGDFAGGVNAASIKTLNVTGNLTANVTAGTITSMTVRGSVSNAFVSTTGAGVDLARVTVIGAISGSTFSATGSIGAVTARELDSSHIYAGVGNFVVGQVLPNFNTDFVAPASIASVRLKTLPAGASFSNSDIAAQSLGKLYLGTILTSNGSQVTGVAAQSIALFNAVVGKKISLKNLTSASNVPALLTGLGVDLGDFVIKLF